MTGPKVLIVLTSHNKLGDSGQDTGWYLPEFAHPYDVFKKNECDITVASPKGGKAPLDKQSDEDNKEDPISQNFLKEQTHLWENTAKLSEFIGKAGDYDALFYVGGHGPMYDLATDQTSIDLIREFYEKGKIVSAVCHGPAVFVNVKLSNGENILKGQECTGFTDSEERLVQKEHLVPFSLETRMREEGGNFKHAGEDWEDYVAVGRDGKLITGQNPKSAKPLAIRILKQLGIEHKN